METLPQSDSDTESRSTVPVKVEHEVWLQLCEERTRLIRAGEEKLSLGEIFAKAWSVYLREVSASSEPPPKAAA